jgi:hypothetical protein
VLCIINGLVATIARSAIATGAGWGFFGHEASTLGGTTTRRVMLIVCIVGFQNVYVTRFGILDASQQQALTVHLLLETVG